MYKFISFVFACVLCVKTSSSVDKFFGIPENKRYVLNELQLNNGLQNIPSTATLLHITESVELPKDFSENHVKLPKHIKYLVASVRAIKKILLLERDFFYGNESYTQFPHHITHLTIEDTKTTAIDCEFVSQAKIVHLILNLPEVRSIGDKFAHSNNLQVVEVIDLNAVENIGLCFCRSDSLRSFKTKSNSLYSIFVELPNLKKLGKYAFGQKNVQDAYFFFPNLETIEGVFLEVENINFCPTKNPISPSGLECLVLIAHKLKNLVLGGLKQRVYLYLDDIKSVEYVPYKNTSTPREKIPYTRPQYFVVDPYWESVQRFLFVSKDKASLTNVCEVIGSGKIDFLLLNDLRNVPNFSSSYSDTCKLMFQTKSVDMFEISLTVQQTFAKREIEREHIRTPNINSRLLDPNDHSERSINGYGSLLNTPQRYSVTTPNDLPAEDNKLLSAPEAARAFLQESARSNVSQESTRSNVSQEVAPNPNVFSVEDLQFSLPPKAARPFLEESVRLNASQQNVVPSPNAFSVEDVTVLGQTEESDQKSQENLKSNPKENSCIKP